MNAFITGAAGFIGSNLADRLLRDEHQVVGYDNFSTGRRRVLDDAARSDRFTLVEGDTLDVERLTAAMRGWIGDSPFIFLDTSKIRSLGWTPKLSIRDGIIRTLDYLRANPWLLV